MSEESSKNHSLIMENRKKITLTGVRDVESFEENLIILITELGKLTVKGELMHITAFESGTGDLTMEGKISTLAYSNAEAAPTSFFGKLFK